MFHVERVEVKRHTGNIREIHTDALGMGRGGEGIDVMMRWHGLGSRLVQETTSSDLGLAMKGRS